MLNKNLKEEIFRTREIMGIISEQKQQDWSMWDKLLYLFNAGDMAAFEEQMKKIDKEAEEKRKEYEVLKDKDGEVVLKPGITGADNVNFLKGHCMRYCEMGKTVYDEFLTRRFDDFGIKEVNLLMALIEGLEMCEFDDMHKGALGPECTKTKKDLEYMLGMLGYKRK